MMRCKGGETVNILIKAGKIALGLVTAGIGVVACITGAVTTMAAMNDENSEQSENSSEE